jgi:hypothetical protein
MADTPFDTIESAQQFVKLLKEQVLIAESEIVQDIRVAVVEDAARRLDALRLVQYKLKQLEDHLGGSSRILNDLRFLRRVLTGDGGAAHRPTLPAAALDANTPAYAAANA